MNFSMRRELLPDTCKHQRSKEKSVMQHGPIYSAPISFLRFCSAIQGSIFGSLISFLFELSKTDRKILSSTCFQSELQKQSTKWISNLLLKDCWCRQVASLMTHEWINSELRCNCEDRNLNNVLPHWTPARAYNSEDEGQHSLTSARCSFAPGRRAQ